MFTRIILSLLILVAFSGCITERYHGKVLAPTATADIAYSCRDIPKDQYEQMGHLDIIADTTCSSEEINAKIIKSAKAKGADLALVDWFDARFGSKHKDHDKCSKDGHCSKDGCVHNPNPYKHKQLIKVVLLKKKSKTVAKNTK